MMEQYDILIHRGETFWKEIRIKENGVPIDLENWSGSCQVRSHPDGGNLILSVMVIFDLTENTVNLYASDEMTAAIPSGVYAWDLKLIDPDEIVRYLIGGAFKVLPVVTE